MDLKTALDIFEINDNEYSTLNEPKLKKKYHKLALANHPDKNGNTIQSKDKFQNIQLAFEYLKNEINFLEKETPDDLDYTNILSQFINEIFENNYSDIFESNYSELIKDIIIGCKKLSFKLLFENIEKLVAIEIYIFLSKYQKLFHISNETLNEIKEIILNKCSKDQLFILNPCLTDLFQQNIYKLKVEDEIYFVPLWHSECYFDGINGDIIVKCLPQLPENVEIDEDNNIIIHVKIPFTFSFLNMKEFNILLEENTSINIPVKDLKVEKFQTYIMKNKGIPMISDNIYDVDYTSDLIIKITFTEN
jgi:hypothetical protein